MEFLKKFFTALGEILLAAIDAIGSIIKGHPKFFGGTFIICAIFLGCMVNRSFMDFIAQVIAIGVMIGLGYLIFKPKPQSPKPKKKK